MLTLSELARAAAALDARCSGHRLERVVQPAPDRVVLTLYGRDPDSGESARRHLLICAHPALARVSELDAPLAAPRSPPAFASFLRAHMSPSRVHGCSLRGSDRQLALELETREGRYTLLLALMGGRTNLYVLDADDCVVCALRPLEKTRADLAPGAPWRDPPPRAGGSDGDRFQHVADAELLLAIEALYAERESQDEHGARVRRLAQALRKERKGAARRLERVEAELAEADQASVLQRHGELLKGALNRISPGDTEVRVNDYETGEEIEIPLDPARSPRQNLDDTFKRYQKLVRRLTKAGGQVEQHRERVRALDALTDELAALPEGDGAALEDFAARADVRAIADRHVSRRQADAGGEPEREKKRPFGGLAGNLRPKRYLSRDGLEIWVGRSDAGNDHLSTRLARGKDLFFHLDGAPGSHVILRTEGRADPPSESLLDACELAVHFSKFKNAPRADVHVVPIKNVKKPKGAKPGLVYVTGGKTIHLRREERRKERVLASRIDD